MRWALAAVLAISGFAQTRGMVSDTRITLDGRESFTLPQASGDWFVTPADAHVAIQVRNATARLDLQLNGRATTQTITGDNNTDVQGDHVGFYWHSPGRNVSPHGADAITVEVARIDERDFEARVSGTAEGTKLDGTIHLHRDAAPAPKRTGKYGDCDPVIHDKLVMAQARSASDCEMKFDRSVRDALAEALRPVAQYYETREWQVVKQSEPRAITNIARRSELAPYRLEATHEGTMVLELQLTGAAMAQYQERLRAITERMAADIAAGHADASMKQVADFGYEMDGATKLRVAVSINAASVSLVSFGGGHSPMHVPAATYALNVAHVQAAIGGGADHSHPESVILLGRWIAPAVQRQADGGEHITCRATLDNAARLAVQNIVIHIQGNAALAQEAASKIDLAALGRLMGSDLSVR